MVTFKDVKIGYITDKHGLIVKDYNQLAKELKLLKINPQEAFDLVFKNKFQFNKRYYWTLKRIGFYINRRYFRFIYYVYSSSSSNQFGV